MSTGDRMVESLRRCAKCGHIASVHGGAVCNARLAVKVYRDDGAELSKRCNCDGFVPGELSDEGMRAIAPAGGVH
jgi:hypothetical protein